MKALTVVVLLTLLALVVLGPYVILRNTLVQKNETAKAARSQPDIVLERRADQFPSPAAPIHKQARRATFYEAAEKVGVLPSKAP